MGVRILAHAPMLALLLLCSILHVRGALQDYDEDPWVEAKSSKKMIVRWQKQNTGCGAMR